VSDELAGVQVCAASEMRVEAWDIWSKASNLRAESKESFDMAAVLKRSSFLGQVDVPLSETLPAATRRSSAPENSAFRASYALARRHGADLVSGTVNLSFDWSITATSLLKQKCSVLEKVLATRNEILSMMAPKSVQQTANLIHKAASSEDGNTGSGASSRV
jgi:hypothetical protein